MAKCFSLGIISSLKLLSLKVFEVYTDFSVIGNLSKFGFALAKPVLSSAEGALRTPSDRPNPVIPSESEGSKKDFSLRSK
jgi:hypothetical protein